MAQFKISAFDLLTIDSCTKLWVDTYPEALIVEVVYLNVEDVLL
jgi:hypothetical protein